jgi:DNA-binding NtrC family response regulator
MESDDIIHLASLPEVILKGTKVQESSDESIIDIVEIKNSVLDKDSDDEMENYNFNFAQLTEGAGVKLDFQTAKDQFEKEFIVQALKLNKGRINQTALNANIPKKTLLRKIEKYSISAREYYS